MQSQPFFSSLSPPSSSSPIISSHIFLVISLSLIITVSSPLLRVHCTPPLTQSKIANTVRGSSLTLPPVLRQSTLHGKTLGDIRLLALGNADPAASPIAGILLEGNEDVADVGPSEVMNDGLVVRASTDWIEHNDAHGLEKFEPTRNVEILDVSKLASTGEVRFESSRNLTSNAIGYSPITPSHVFYPSFTNLFKTFWKS